MRDTRTALRNYQGEYGGIRLSKITFQEMRSLDCLPFRLRNHRSIVALRHYFDQSGRISAIETVDADERCPCHRRSNASGMEHTWDHAYILREDF